MASGELQISRNTLGALVLVFAVYLVVDAAYLWRGRPPVGVTTQEYAHQGALWLTVALAMLTGTVAVMFRGAAAHDPRTRSLRALAHVWTALGLGLALGTYQRIAIHVGRSGLSDLRIVGILGTTVVIAGMVLTLVKLRSGRTFRWLLRRQLDALALTFVLYAVLPTHCIGACVNVGRIEDGALGPLLHVRAQSRFPESAPLYLALLDHPDARVREGVAAMLLRVGRWGDVDHRPLAWSERNALDPWAAGELRAAAPRLHAALGDAEPADAERVLAVLATAGVNEWGPDMVASIAPAIRRRAP
jgi:hypothetical protein